MHLGALEKESTEMGILLRTKLSKVTLPPNEMCFPLQALNLIFNLEIKKWPKLLPPMISTNRNTKKHKRKLPNKTTQKRRNRKKHMILQVRTIDQTIIQINAQPRNQLKTTKDSFDTPHILLRSIINKICVICKLKHLKAKLKATWKPLKQPEEIAFHIKPVKPSATNKKEKGDRGSPWRNPQIPL